MEKADRPRAIQVVIYSLTDEPLPKKLQQELKSATIDLVRKYKIVAHLIREE